MPTVHLLIKGKVQGVFYRATAKDVAKQVGVSGWIKNTRSGDVEAVISGDLEKVNQFTAWCRQGPPQARVEEVLVTEKEETPFSNFSIERS